MRWKILALCLGLALSALILQTFLYLRTSAGIIYRQAKEEDLWKDTGAACGRIERNAV